jgi:hemolysin activation/secretion protein
MNGRKMARTSEFLLAQRPVRNALLMAIFIGLAGVVFAPAVEAQVPAAAPPAIPGSADASRIEERFQSDSVANPSTRAPLTIEREDTEAPKGAETTKLTLKNVVIDGPVTVYKQADLAPLYQGELDKEITLADVYKIADDLTVKYRNDGYILAKAIVPPQRIEGGVVHIRVVEGYVIKVEYDGDTRGNQYLLDQYAIAIQNDRPLKSETLERYLLMINDLPGVSAGSILQPSPLDPGAANLTIILNQKPFDVFATLDDRGSSYIGQYQDALAGRFNNLLGAFDQTRLQVASVPGKERELQFANAEEAIPIGLEGTTVSLSGTYAHSRPAFRLEAIDLESEDKTADISIAHPVIRSRSENLNLLLDYGVRDSRSDIKPAQENLYVDRLRVFRETANYQTSDLLLDREGSNAINFGLHEGVPGMGATDYDQINKSRADGHADFVKMTSEVSRVQQIEDKVSVQVAGIGQYSYSSLLASEQFGLGGAQYDRAYDPSEFLGDSGYAAKVELRYSDTLPTGPLHSYQLYTYYDTGQVWNRHPQLGDPTNGLTAQSLGGGVRYTFTDYMSGYVEIAQPIARALTTSLFKETRAFFSLQVHY